MAMTKFDILLEEEWYQTDQESGKERGQDLSGRAQDYQAGDKQPR